MSSFAEIFSNNEGILKKSKNFSKDYKTLESQTTALFISYCGALPFWNGFCNKYLSENSGSSKKDASPVWHALSKEEQLNLEFLSYIGKTASKEKKAPVSDEEIEVRKKSGTACFNGFKRSPDCTGKDNTEKNEQWKAVKKTLSDDKKEEYIKLYYATKGVIPTPAPAPAPVKPTKNKKKVTKPSDTDSDSE